MEAGLSLAPLSLTIFGISILASRRAGRTLRRPRIMLIGCGLLSLGILALIPLVPRVDTGWYLVGPLVVVGGGLGLVVSQLNNYTLAPISDERASEGAGVNSAAGSFGLSFGLACAGAVMLATLSIAFTNLSDDSAVLPAQDKQHVAKVLEDDAEVMSDAQLGELLADEPRDIRGEIISINTDARHRALQVALLVPLLAGLLGLANSVRMRRAAAAAQLGLLVSSFEGDRWRSPEGDLARVATAALHRTVDLREVEGVVEVVLLLVASCREIEVVDDEQLLVEVGGLDELEARRAPRSQNRPRRRPR